MQLTQKHESAVCEPCKRFKGDSQYKLCHMYALQNGATAWICDDCRKGLSIAEGK